MKQSYRPSEEILAKYAELLVTFGLQTEEGKKIKKGSVVKFTVPEVAKPLYFHLQTAILKAGCHPLGMFMPSDEGDYQFEKAFCESAKNHQLDFTSEDLNEAEVNHVDASIRILAETNLHSLNDINPKRVMRRTAAVQKGKKPFYKKIDSNELTWTMGLYGTDAMAKEAGMSTKAYWNQIIKACYLDAEDPIGEWKKINKIVVSTANKLTKMQIKSLHMVGSDVDLHVGIGKDRLWLAGGGCNIPSYEVFTTPNSHQIDGWILFNQPLFRYGKRIENIKLHFKNGKVIKSSASKNESLLKEMLKVTNADQVGEFSLTDSRLSRITKFMAETLYDENVGGKYGNSHLALGFSFKQCFTGNSKTFTDDDWQEHGFNQSSLHNDIVTTTDRTVTATLYDGTEKVIYEKGQFTI